MPAFNRRHPIQPQATPEILSRWAKWRLRAGRAVAGQPGRHERAALLAALSFAQDQRRTACVQLDDLTVRTLELTLLVGRLAHQDVQRDEIDEDCYKRDSVDALLDVARDTLDEAEDLARYCAGLRRRTVSVLSPADLAVRVNSLIGSMRRTLAILRDEVPFDAPGRSRALQVLGGCLDDPDAAPDPTVGLTSTLIAARSTLVGLRSHIQAVAVPAEVRHCRYCLCTVDSACVTERGTEPGGQARPCAWLADDVCSACRHRWEADRVAARLIDWIDAALAEVGMPSATGDRLVIPDALTARLATAPRAVRALRVGSITFTPPTGATVTRAIMSDGRFTLPHNLPADTPVPWVATRHTDGQPEKIHGVCTIPSGTTGPHMAYIDRDAAGEHQVTLLPARGFKGVRREDQD